MADNTADNRIVILFIAANPANTPKLNLDREIKFINEVLQKAQYRDQFDLRSAWAVGYKDLPELLLQYKPHIVHFSGHGSTVGEIVLEDERGGLRPIPASSLVELFKILKDNVRCVVLNACYTELQARAIAENIDYVVGMSRAIADDVAIEFAAGLYLGLG